MAQWRRERTRSSMARVFWRSRPMESSLSIGNVAPSRGPDMATSRAFMRFRNYTGRTPPAGVRQPVALIAGGHEAQLVLLGDRALERIQRFDHALHQVVGLGDRRLERFYGAAVRLERLIDGCQARG